MIMSSSAPCQVGTVVTDRLICGRDGVYRRQPVYIIREATREEWLEHARKWEAASEDHLQWEASTRDYFYLVSVD